MTSPILEESPIDSITGSDGHWVVCVHNNETNSFDEVINILMRATKCTREEAEMETWEIHNLGKAVVHHGSEEDCQEAGAIISSIGVQVEVYKE